MKQCNKCTELKALDEFYKDRTSKDGHGRSCKECVKARMRAWEKTHRDRVYAAHKRYRKSRPDKIRAAACITTQNYRARLRQEALVHYSNDPPVCACCGEDHIEFLEIDHINGGGMQHKKSSGTKQGGSWIYWWLRKHGYPEGFQVLCSNCNRAKFRCGICPHQRERLIAEQSTVTIEGR